MASPLRFAGIVLSAGLVLSLSTQDRYLSQLIKDPDLRDLLFAESYTTQSPETSITTPMPYGLQYSEDLKTWIMRLTPEQQQRLFKVMPLEPGTDMTLELTPDRMKACWMDEDLTLGFHEHAFMSVETETTDTTQDGTWI